jgi:acetylornithine deacetylase/succinyl-diaminopimelate desuccinylase-like protein
VPTLKAGEMINSEWRLYARSASDDKAGVVAVLTAIDALKATGKRPTSNIKISFEGEEEAGSPLASMKDRTGLGRRLLR